MTLSIQRYVVHPNRTTELNQLLSQLPSLQDLQLRLCKVNGIDISSCTIRNLKLRLIGSLVKFHILRLSLPLLELFHFETEGHVFQFPTIHGEIPLHRKVVLNLDFIGERDVYAENDQLHYVSHAEELILHMKECPSMADGLRQLEEITEKALDMLEFLEGFGAALKEQLHTDIAIKPCNGPPILAHRALLAARSQVLKNMLASDECKAPAVGEISLLEFTHDELESFVHFLYYGYMSNKSNAKHYYCLLVAADKYDIPYLRKYCERHILRSLKPSNALEVLEISDICENVLLKEQAMDMVVKNAEEVVFSTEYGEFALKNTHLCVEITRELLVGMKDSKTDAL